MSYWCGLGGSTACVHYLDTIQYKFMSLSVTVIKEYCIVSFIVSSTIMTLLQDMVQLQWNLGTPPVLVKESRDPSVMSQRHASVFYSALQFCTWTFFVMHSALLARPQPLVRSLTICWSLTIQKETEQKDTKFSTTAKHLAKNISSTRKRLTAS